MRHLIRRVALLILTLFLIGSVSKKYAKVI